MHGKKPCLQTWSSFTLYSLRNTPSNAVIRCAEQPWTPKVQRFSYRHKKDQLENFFDAPLILRHFYCIVSIWEIMFSAWILQHLPCPCLQTWLLFFFFILYLGFYNHLMKCAQYCSNSETRHQTVMHCTSDLGYVPCPCPTTPGVAIIECAAGVRPSRPYDPQYWVGLFTQWSWKHAHTYGASSGCPAKTTPVVNRPLLSICEGASPLVTSHGFHHCCRPVITATCPGRSTERIGLAVRHQETDSHQKLKI